MTDASASPHGRMLRGYSDLGVFKQTPSGLVGPRMTGTDMQTAGSSVR